MLQVVKLEHPKPFKGKVDGDSLHAFLFVVVQYFSFTRLSDPVQKTHFVILLLTEHAAIWV